MIKTKVFGFVIGSLLGLGAIASSHATLIHLPVTAEPIAIDPADEFAAKCLGAVEDPSCEYWAAGFRVELGDLQVRLAGDRSPETRALFEQMLELGDSRLKVQALNYLNSLYYYDQPQGFWDKIRNFLFGEDTVVGYRAASMLSRSDDARDKALSKWYQQGREGLWYGEDVEWPTPEGENHAWVEGSWRDLWLSQVEAWQGQIFPGATRLVIADEVIEGNYYDQRPVAATGFVTDASYEEVFAYYKNLLGGREPALPMSEIEARGQALNEELMALQARLQAGDMSVMPRFQAIIQESQELGNAAQLVSMLGFRDIDKMDRAWIEAAGDSPYEMRLVRAVAIRFEPLLGKVVIRHFSH